MAEPREGLTIDYCGEVATLQDGDELTFGRSADLVIDDNPRLHRILGRVYRRGGTWWIRNEGRALSITIGDLDSPSRVTLTSGREAALTFARTALRFRAGATQYEIEIRVETESAPPHAATDLGDDTTDNTLRIAQVPLTGEQRLLLVNLARYRLLDPHGPLKIPSNRQIASYLGWTDSKFNRKLDNLCVKFSRLGISGLRGSPGELASDRRTRLVEAVIEHGVVSVDDIDRDRPWEFCD